MTPMRYIRFIFRCCVLLLILARCEGGDTNSPDEGGGTALGGGTGGAAETSPATTGGRTTGIGELGGAQGIPFSMMRVAFQTTRDGDNEIYLLDVSSLETTRVTRSSAQDSAPALAADGSWVAYVSDQDGDADIYRISTLGTDNVPINLTVEDQNGAADTDPAVSPDGRQIAFISNRTGENDLYVMRSNGSAITRLTEHGEAADPAWSPLRADGSAQLLYRHAGGLTIIEANGTNEQQIVNDPDAMQTAWSPDGTRIAFASTRNGNAEIYVINRDGSALTPLTSEASADTSPTWSSDGTWIVFQSDRTGTGTDLYIVPSLGGEAVRLTDDPAQDGAPNWGR